MYVFIFHYTIILYQSMIRFLLSTKERYYIWLLRFPKHNNLPFIWHHSPKHIFQIRFRAILLVVWVLGMILSMHQENIKRLEPTYGLKIYVLKRRQCTHRGHNRKERINKNQFYSHVHDTHLWWTILFFNWQYNNNGTTRRLWQPNNVTLHHFIKHSKWQKIFHSFWCMCALINQYFKLCVHLIFILVKTSLFVQ